MERLRQVVAEAHHGIIADLSRRETELAFESIVATAIELQAAIGRRGAPSDTKGDCDGE